MDPTSPWYPNIVTLLGYRDLSLAQKVSYTLAVILFRFYYVLPVSLLG